MIIESIYSEELKKSFNFDFSEILVGQTQISEDELIEKEGTNVKQ